MPYKLTLKEVKERINAIHTRINDDEKAHAAEDALHRDILRAIAQGHPRAQRLATLGLTTCELGFCRWYA